MRPVILQEALEPRERFFSDTCGLIFDVSSPEAEFTGFTLRLTITEDQDGTHEILTVEAVIDAEGLAETDWPDPPPQTYKAGDFWYFLKLIDPDGKTCTLGVAGFKVHSA